MASGFQLRKINPSMIRRGATMLYRTFMRGLIVMLPLTITVALVFWFATMLEDMLGAFVKLFIPAERYIRGLGMLAGLVLILAAGATMKTWLARLLLERVESLMQRIPVVKSVYGTVQDLAELFSKRNSADRFQRVVMLTVGENIRLIGFLTRDDVAEIPGEDGEPVVGVYLPMSYQIGGYTVMVPRSAVEPIDMSVEDAARFVLTAGLSRTQGNAAAKKSP